MSFIRKLKNLRIQKFSVIKRNFLIALIALFVYTISFIGSAYFTDRLIFSPNFPNNNGKPIIGIYTSSNHLGENELGVRLQIEANRLDWNSYLFRLGLVQNFPVLNFPIYLVDYALKFFCKIDYTIAVTHLVSITGTKPRYLFINVPPNDIITDDGELKDYRRYLRDYNGIIDINVKKHDIISSLLGKEKKYINFVVPVMRTTYEECIPKKLTIAGANIGKLKSSKPYRKMLKTLADYGYTEFYGPQSAWGFVGNHYKGVLAENGTHLLQKLKENCLVLVYHSENHLDAEIQTTRILEAVASGASTISDMNPFIMKEFGDSVLYYDQTKSGPEMAAQINDHVKWIFSHQQEARAKAKRAHEIFLAKFTAEKFLLALQKMHEELSNAD